MFILLVLMALFYTAQCQQRPNSGPWRYFAPISGATRNRGITGNLGFGGIIFG